MFEHQCATRIAAATLVVPVVLLLGLLTGLAAEFPALNGPQAASGAAGGAIEGHIDLTATAARTVERYFTSAGEPREAKAVPVAVFIEGKVAAAPPARPSGPLSIVQRGETFGTALLVVPAGTAVAFPNDDPVFHNVFSYSRPKRFDLGRYRQGESKSVVFDRPGYVKVMCEVHKWMRAGILVVENPYYTVVPPTGRFRIDGVPPGRYRLAIEHFERREHRDVEVSQGGTVRIDARL